MPLSQKIPTPLSRLLPQLEEWTDVAESRLCLPSNVILRDNLARSPEIWSLTSLRTIQKSALRSQQMHFNVRLIRIQRKAIYM